MDTRDAVKKWLILIQDCIINVATTARYPKDQLDIKGQLEGETIWKGWAWNKLLCKTVIYH